MKHVFLVNPCAGKGNYHKYIAGIEEYFKKNGGVFEIIITESADDLKEHVKNIGMSGLPHRIYSCGGDGTLFNIVNAAYGFSMLEIGCFPIGSGNDFIKFFGDRSAFLNIEYLINGSAIPVDLIKAGDEYCINQCSAGMDAMVAHNMVKFRRWPLVSGKASYYLSLLYTFFSKITFNITSATDEGEPITRKCLFAIAANAPYHGGGFKGAPTANPSDGYLERVLITSTSRLKVLRLLGAYRRGDTEKIRSIYNCTSAKKITFSSDSELFVVLDGEIRRSYSINMEIVPKALNFIVPAICTIKNSDEVFLKTKGSLGTVPMMPMSPTKETKP